MPKLLKTFDIGPARVGTKTMGICSIVPMDLITGNE